jgi:hypothetical protein
MNALRKLFVKPAAFSICLVAALAAAQSPPLPSQ